jgi:hypothetical protein
VVSGGGARRYASVLFGTEPMVRDHPKGLHVQAVQSHLWSVSR